MSDPNPPDVRGSSPDEPAPTVRGALLPHIMRRMHPILNQLVGTPSAPEHDALPLTPEAASTAEQVSEEEGKARRKRGEGSPRADRSGKVLIGGWYDISLSVAIKQLALSEHKTQQAIVEEALRMLIASRR